MGQWILSKIKRLLPGTGGKGGVWGFCGSWIGSENSDEFGF